LNETNQINKSNQMNHANQSDERASCQLIHDRLFYLPLPLPGPYALQFLAALRNFVQLRLDNQTSIRDSGFDLTVEHSQIRGKRRRHRVVAEMLFTQPVTFLNLIPPSEFSSLTGLRRQDAQVLLPDFRTVEW
jgi:hypothetical protein